MKKPNDWRQPCPNPECGHYCMIGHGNVRAITTYETKSGKRRIFECNRCRTAFSATRDTVFYNLRTPEEKVMMALKMMLVRVDLAFSISTSLIERLNLTLRQALAPLTRKSLAFCKDRDQMKKRVVLFHAFYNFARPHHSLKIPIPEDEREISGLIRPKWIKRAPGMAAGIADHVWSFRELFTVRFEPIHNQSIRG